MGGKHRKRNHGSQSRFGDRAYDAEKDESLPTGWDIDTYNRLSGNEKSGYKGTGAEVAYEDSRAMQRYERERAGDIKERQMYFARRRQREINALKSRHEYVTGNPEPGAYTIEARDDFVDPDGLQVNQNGRYVFNDQGNLKYLEPLAPFFIHRPDDPTPDAQPNRAQRRAGKTQAKERYSHMTRSWGDLYSLRSNWAVDFDMPTAPPRSTSSLGWKHFETLPKPDRIDVRIRPDGDYDVTYTWAKSRISRSKLQHALNGNISFFECKACAREFTIKGKSRDARCMRCKNMATFVGTKLVEKTGPKGGRAGKTQKLISDSEKRTDAEAAGARDATREKTEEKLELTVTTPEGHLIDMPPDGDKPPEDDTTEHTPDQEVEETPFQMPESLYMQHSSRHGSNNTLYAMCFVKMMAGLVGFSLYKLQWKKAALVCLFCLFLPFFKKTQPYLRFDLIGLHDEEGFPDMRPDYMSHTKFKHQGRKATYSVTATNSCHVQGNRRLEGFRNLWDKLLGNSADKGSIVVDVEVFSQVCPSIKMVPEQHALDRVDNSISRLATVNCDRRNTKPFLDNTLTLLKAYHWHHVQVKLAIGYFSPYELIAPTRR